MSIAIEPPSTSGRRILAALYAAGFMAAFGAHAVAANLGGYAEQREATLLWLGVLLALYDGAEVILKPVFGAIADRIGAKPVLIGGLIGFAIASLAFVVAGNPGLLAVARTAQGASAAAFSPAASALVAVHGGSRRRGRSFGGYTAAKSLGYMLGPLVGSAVVQFAGYLALFGLLGALAAGVAAYCALRIPITAPAPKHRETLIGLVRRAGDASFLLPVAALAGVTGALSTGTGFLPVVGLRDHLSIAFIGACVSLLAVASTITSYRAGRALDEGHLRLRTGLAAGLALAASGLVVGASVPGVLGLTLGEVLIGVGVGMATPLGFAALAEIAPSGRMGLTMGAAEVGRELGDAGGPLLVGVLSTFSLATGLLGLGAILALIAGASVINRSSA